MPKANCLHCKKEFEYNSGTHYGKYCGNKCQAKYQSAKKKADWYACINEHTPRGAIRRYLIEDREYKCEVPGCGLSEWLGKSISLQVDHINGNPGDDRPENVRLICPNCHTQTPFYGAKNKGNGRKSRGLPTK